MTKYEELESKRLELYNVYKTNNKKASYYVIGAVAAFIIGFLVEAALLPFIIIGIVLIVVAATYYNKASQVNNQFRTFVKTELVDKLLSSYFEKYDYIEKGHILVKEANNAGLMKSPDRHTGEDLITGEYKNIKFRVSDLKFEERQVVRTKNGTYVTYVPYFTGRWYVYKFPKKFEHTLKIVESKTGVNTRGLKKYETEMIEFNRKFNIYSSDQSFFYQLINPYMIERLLLLEQAHRGKINYAFIGDELHIAINDGSNSLELSFKKEINQANIIHFEDDIKLIKDIVDEFYLDDVKFR